MTTWARLAAIIGVALGAAGVAQAAPAGSKWDGAYFGNAELVTQDAQKVKLYDDLLRGKIVVLSFVYTRCTKQCGLITASLARVQRLLGERMGKDVFFYSISIDPERDTPAVLKEYATAFRAGPGWTFLTGAKADIAEIRRKFGDLTTVEGHSANLLIGNEVTGQWMAKGAIDSPQYLAMVIGDWMDPAWGTRAATGAPAGQLPPAAGRASPPARQAALDGRTLFAGKCAACHGKDGRGTEDGPSLSGVAARRERGWLVAWVRGPGALVAKGDPTAVALVDSFRGNVMPTLDLSADDAAAVVEYLAVAQ
ncbi:MAG: SCO family protein [Anaeromyxobacteraceae bacterium]